jgi:hypothetical protein
MMTIALVVALLIVADYAYGLWRKLRELKFREFIRRMDGHDEMSLIRDARLEAEKRMCEVGMPLDREGL